MVRQGGKILGKFRDFLGKNRTIKEMKDRVEASGLQSGFFCRFFPVNLSLQIFPGHLRPVTMKPVGWSFEISGSNLIRGKCGNCRRSLSPPPWASFEKTGISKSSGKCQSPTCLLHRSSTSKTQNVVKSTRKRLMGLTRDKKVIANATPSLQHVELRREVVKMWRNEQKMFV